MHQDTIAAISTPIGEGGIGIVRLSGPESLSIIKKIFSSALSDHQLTHGHVIDPKTSEVIDEVLVSYMVSPRTYTTEDIVEINCHGGSMSLQRILGLTLHYGARMAEPGEFTLRAFINGRIDLAQAESVLDIIQSKTEASLRLAMQGLAGKLSGEIHQTRKELLSVLAYLAARIDFPEDEVEEQDALKPIQRAIGNIQTLIAKADAGIIYRHGIRTAIIGRPNVGKSSLLNRLLRDNRAIVTPVPGTTRDTIEEAVNLNGIPFVLIDTAGIIESSDSVEAIGVERSQNAIKQADFILLVIDGSQSLTDSDSKIITLLCQKTVLVAANKCDLPAQADLSNLTWPVISTSALIGEGFDKLEEKMSELALGGKVVSSDSLMVTSIRHKEALGKAIEYLTLTQKSLQDNVPDDFVTIDLTAALNALGEITGETVTDDLLETIFSNFCIGK